MSSATSFLSPWAYKMIQLKSLEALQMLASAAPQGHYLVFYISPK